MNVYIILCLGKYNMEEQHLNKQFKALATFKTKFSFVQNTQPIKKKTGEFMCNVSVKGFIYIVPTCEKRINVLQSQGY